MNWYSSEEVYRILARNSSKLLEIELNLRNRGGWVPLLSFGQRLTQPTAVNLTVKKASNWLPQVAKRIRTGTRRSTSSSWKPRSFAITSCKRRRFLEVYFLWMSFKSQDGERFTGIYLEPLV